MFLLSFKLSFLLSVKDLISLDNGWKSHLANWELYGGLEIMVYNWLKKNSLVPRINISEVHDVRILSIMEELW